MTTKTPLVALYERLLQQQPGFDDARSGFYKKKTKLNDIRQVIATTHNKKRAAEEQAVMDNKGWRKQFRKAQRRTDAGDARPAYPTHHQT